MQLDYMDKSGTNPRKKKKKTVTDKGQVLISFISHKGHERRKQGLPSSSCPLQSSTWKMEPSGFMFRCDGNMTKNDDKKKNR